MNYYQFNENLVALFLCVSNLLVTYHHTMNCLPLYRMEEQQWQVGTVGNPYSWLSDENKLAEKEVDVCGAMGYAQTGWSPVELRSWTLVGPNGGNFHLHGTEGVPSCLLAPWLLLNLPPPHPPQERIVASSHVHNVPSF